MSTSQPKVKRVSQLCFREGFCFSVSNGGLHFISHVISINVFQKYVAIVWRWLNLFTLTFAYISFKYRYNLIKITSLKSLKATLMQSNTHSYATTQTRPLALLLSVVPIGCWICTDCGFPQFKIYSRITYQNYCFLTSCPLSLIFYPDLDINSLQNFLTVFGYSGHLIKILFHIVNNTSVAFNHVINIR